MKVKDLIKLLKKEKPNAEVLAWVANEHGYALLDIGIEDAIIGYLTQDYPCEKEFVLIPIDVDVKFTPWENLDKLRQLN